MGTKDLPATIDYITKLTGHDKISYVGHSQGTTQLLAGAGVDPDYFNSKIAVAILLAPPMSMFNTKDEGMRDASEPFTMAALIAYADSIEWWNLSEYGSFDAKTESLACKVFDGILCKYFLNLFGGGDS
jgi:pimeloyl-ACP methyl ester carboxylesterase